MKTCTRCKEEKPLDEFRKDPRYKGGHKTHCLVCVRELQKLCFRRQPLEKKTRQARKWQRSYLYGLSEEQFKSLHSKQEGKCAICSTPERECVRQVLYVDHNHKTGEVRGLLCSHCNSAIGQFKESAELLTKAISYVSGF